MQNYIVSIIPKLKESNIFPIFLTFATDKNTFAEKNKVYVNSYVLLNFCIFPY